MKRGKFHRNHDAGKQGAQSESNANVDSQKEEKHNHYHSVRNKLVALGKDLEHEKTKEWISEDEYKMFSDMNAQSITAVDAKIAAL